MTYVQECFDSLEKSNLSSSACKEVLTVYDGEDLNQIAEESGISSEEVVRLHSAKEYRVYAVGFTPGFAYMGTTDDRLNLPRRSTPRTQVPAGSVAIAMGQTGIYPSTTPGGWHLIGRAEHRTLFNPNANPPSRFVAGDRVRFVPVNELARVEELSPSPILCTHPNFVVEDGGFLTTVQDLGRFGFQRYGVPVAGAVDSLALSEANELVGNESNSAALECTVAGPRLRCLQPTSVAITGANFGAVVERYDLGQWHPPLGSSFQLRPGNVLAFEGRISGARAYVAIGGGIDVPVVLGSRSTYLPAGFGGFAGRSLRGGDKLSAVVETCESTLDRVEPREEAPATTSKTRVLRVIWGPQDDYFTDSAKQMFEQAIYHVSDSSDRMGCRLVGSVLEHKGSKEIISDGNTIGSVQVPPNGLPIVMLADRATTGGYPKIATVVTQDVSLMGQLLPGEAVRFSAMTLDQYLSELTLA